MKSEQPSDPHSDAAKFDMHAIDYPDDAAVALQVQSIVAAGLVRQPSFLTSLKTMHTQLGFKYLFRDWTEIVFVLLLCCAAYGFIGAELFVYSRHFSIDQLYSFLFILSPLLYLVTAALFFINKRTRDTYDVEMSCKYNIYQLAAFRMLVFSVFGMIVNALGIFVLAAVNHDINPLFALALSGASLFLFANLFLYVLLRIRSRLARNSLIAGWLVFNLSAASLSSSVYLQVLTSIPTFVYMIITFAGVALYCRHLKRLISFRSTGGTI
ncbi:hypothetical protein EBB07_24660 [Paenibacillaceae bacterium]|nr:hypothetical protein EBB07_24660 [Paenibacillaceae bacterium]